MGGEHYPLISYILPVDQQFKQAYPVVLEGLALGRCLDTSKAMNAAGDIKEARPQKWEVQESWDTDSGILT